LEGGSFGFGTVFMLNTDGTDFKALHSFNGADEGGYPFGDLVLSGDMLYGTRLGNRPTADYGGVFAIRTDGSGFTNLYSFSDGDDGAFASGALALSSNTLYAGTTGDGPSSYTNGTLVAINTDGSAFRVLKNLGDSPHVGMVLSSNSLYIVSDDVLFSVGTDGSAYTQLRDFTGNTGTAGGYLPVNLILAGDTLYGTTEYGGLGNGTVFKVKTDGSGFAVLHSFSTTSLLDPNANSDGTEPLGHLLLWNNVLYGTAWMGGSSANGTVFALIADGTGFRVLHTFSAVADSAPHNNTDGANPWGGLVRSGKTL
jgi:uncharacterized repeat protein (TIGR03803 family)